MVRKREDDDVAKAQAALSAAENKARRARKAFMKDLHKEIKACVRLRNDRTKTIKLRKDLWQPIEHAREVAFIRGIQTPSVTP